MDEKSELAEVMGHLKEMGDWCYLLGVKALSIASVLYTGLKHGRLIEVGGEPQMMKVVEASMSFFIPMLESAPADVQRRCRKEYMVDQVLDAFKTDGRYPDFVEAALAEKRKVTISGTEVVGQRGATEEVDRETSIIRSLVGRSFAAPAVEEFDPPVDDEHLGGMIRTVRIFLDAGVEADKVEDEGFMLSEIEFDPLGSMGMKVEDRVTGEAWKQTYKWSGVQADA